MSQPFIGEIRMVGFNFAPINWAFCDGQILSIDQFDTLFALIGITYGGDGQTTFALPDLRSRVPLDMGQGPGLSNYEIGQAAGVESVSLNNNQIPSHTHSLNVDNGVGTLTTPNGNYIAGISGGNNKPTIAAFATSANTTLAANSISATGSGQAHTNIQPYTCVNFIIALQGIFPSRN